MKQSLKKLQLK